MESAGDRVKAGPPPIQQMLAQAARDRRRRALKVTLSSAAATTAVIGGAAYLWLPRESADPRVPADPQPPVASDSAFVAPAGTRLVGLDHAVIEVPSEWGTNATGCGTPMADTVVIDARGIPACGVGRPAGVESVEIWQGEPRFDFKADERIEIDGVMAERQTTTCQPAGGPFGSARTCVGTVYFPSLGVSFRTESSTSAAEVDRILEWIGIIPDRVGVPGYQSITLNRQGRAEETYVSALRKLELIADVRTQKVPGSTAGIVLDVSPAPGTMVKPGDVVTLTVVAEPDGPADEVRVGMGVSNAEDEYRHITDRQIRSGATIDVEVGDQIWAYADGKAAGTLAGELDGSSVAVDDWTEGPNYPHAWEAVSPGQATVTLSITADGQPVTLGVVTVVVE